MSPRKGEYSREDRSSNLGGPVGEDGPSGTGGRAEDRRRPKGAGRDSGRPDSPLPDRTADQRLAERFAPCFTLVLNLRASRDFGDPQALRQRTKELLDEAEREALSAGATPEAIREAKFALVAFIDETVLSAEWSGKDRWASTPLQLELYDQYDAGEVFFDRLERLRERPRANAEVLEVYYLCMALGFKGQYQIHGQERLREIVEGVYEELRQGAGMGERDLAPRGEPRDQVSRELKSRVPTWTIVAATALIGVLIYTGMYFYVSDQASRTADEIEELVPTTVVR